jgi:hypothetical protein
MRVYSFSHLTFQEYLAAQRVAKKVTLLSETAEYITDPHWREVWLLLVTMIDADDIIPELKKRIDMLVDKDPKIQEYLEWCESKASHGGSHKPAAVRAYFFSIALDCDYRLADVLSRNNDLSRVIHRDRVPDETSAFDFALSLACDRALDLFADCGLDAARDRDLAYALGSRRKIDLTYAIDRNIVRDGKLDSDLMGDCDLGLDLALALIQERERDKGPTLALDRAIDRALNRAANASRFVSPALVSELQALRVELPALDQASLPIWCARLRAAAIQHRNIGHEWKFTAVQMRSLQDYYRANLLLVECMNAVRTLTKKTRQYIEDTMLLPQIKIRPAGA